jgi:hypothetical protein
MLYQTFTQTAYIITNTRNEFGERIETARTEFKCLLKEIDGYDRNNKMEFANCDSMIWAAPGLGLDRGTLVKIDDTTYLIDKITIAKRPGSQIAQFVKCGLIRQAESIS